MRKVEIYRCAIKWFDKKRYYGNFKSDHYKGKPVYGWSVTHFKRSSIKELKELLNRELNDSDDPLERRELAQPITFEKWTEDEYGMDISSYESGILKSPRSLTE